MFRRGGSPAPGDAGDPGRHLGAAPHDGGRQQRGFVLPGRRPALRGRRFSRRPRRRRGRGGRRPRRGRSTSSPARPNRRQCSCLFRRTNPRGRRRRKGTRRLLSWSRVLTSMRWTKPRRRRTRGWRRGTRRPSRLWAVGPRKLRPRCLGGRHRNPPPPAPAPALAFTTRPGRGRAAVAPASSESHEDEEPLLPSDPSTQLSTRRLACGLSWASARTRATSSTWSRTRRVVGAGRACKRLLNAWPRSSWQRRQGGVPPADSHAGVSARSPAYEALLEEAVAAAPEMRHRELAQSFWAPGVLGSAPGIAGGR